MAKIYPQSDIGSLIPQPPRLLRYRDDNYVCLLFQLIFVLLCAIGLLLSLSLIIFLMIFGLSRAVQVYVTDASLSDFDFSITGNNSPQFVYQLSLNITMINPNKRIGVIYDRIEAYASYGRNFSFPVVTLTPFYQKPNGVSFLQVVFEGIEALPFGVLDISKFYEEKSVGVYSIVGKFSLRVRNKFGKIKVKGHGNPWLECYLQVPLRSINGGSTHGFKTTECSNV